MSNSIARRLSQTLALRRNLQSALTAPDAIGSRMVRLDHVTPSRHREKLRSSRDNHRQYVRDLLKANGIRSRSQLVAKITELCALEAVLWSEFRPDLYHMTKI